jgi:neutral ceramidase
MRTVRLLLACLLCLAAAAPATARAAEKRLEAGAGQADITPPIGTPMFAFTDRSRVFNPENNTDLLDVLADPDTGLHAKTFVGSTGIHTRLRARAVVIERNGVPFALVQADIGGLPYSLTQAVGDRVRSTGISQDRLLISATHTHSAHGAIWPNEDNLGYGFVGGDIYDERSWNATVDGITSAILRAYANLESARVGIGRTELRGASSNRASEAFALNANKPAEMIDPELNVIRVDSAKGRPLAVWSNFAVHATSFGGGNRLFSGDNPGYTERIVESAIGKGVVNVWTNGNEGDIAPSGGPDRIGDEALQHVPSSAASAHRTGARVAEGILRAWKDAGEHMRGDLAIEARQSFLDFDGTPADGEAVGPIGVLGMGVVAGGQCSPVDGLAGPGQGKKAPLVFGRGIVPNVVPVSVWRVGDLGIAALPSEVTRTMGLRIRDAVAAASGGQLARVALAGLTDGYISYTATPEEYDLCEYEGSFTLYGRRQGPRYRDFTAGLAGSMFAGGPAPAAGAEPPRFGGQPTVAPKPKTTADPGKILTQPAGSVARLGRATFRWQGGDRGVEAPRGKTFVRLQRRSGRKWVRVATDDSFKDTVLREAGDAYLETFQFDACDALGRYRFKVTGRAYDGSRSRPYTTISDPFELTAAKLEAEAPAAGRFRVRYPSPGEGALVSTPRLLMAGRAEVTENGRTRFVEPDAAGVFDIGGGSLVRVTDGCGNATG